MFCIENLLDVINPQKVKKTTVQKFKSKKELKIMKWLIYNRDNQSLLVIGLLRNTNLKLWTFESIDCH